MYKKISHIHSEFWLAVYVIVIFIPLSLLLVWIGVFGKEFLEIQLNQHIKNEFFAIPSG
jgi:choline-glycine betaine transporter